MARAQQLFQKASFCMMSTSLVLVEEVREHSQDVQTHDTEDDDTDQYPILKIHFMELFKLKGLET